MRAKDNFAAQSRVQGVFEKRGLTFSDDIARKTVFVCGDMSKPGTTFPRRLGSDARQASTSVISGGAEVNMVKSYSALEKVNVGGTYNGLELASRAGARHVLISTQYPLPEKSRRDTDAVKRLANCSARARKKKSASNPPCCSSATLASLVLSARSPPTTTTSSSSFGVPRHRFLPANRVGGEHPVRDDCVKMLADISRAGAVDRYAFDGVAREVKGKLMPFSDSTTGSRKKFASAVQL